MGTVGPQAIKRTATAARISLQYHSAVEELPLSVRTVLTVPATSTFGVAQHTSPARNIGQEEENSGSQPRLLEQREN